MEKINWILPKRSELFGKEQTEVVKLSDCNTKSEAKNKEYIEYLEKCIAYRLNGKA